MINLKMVTKISILNKGYDLNTIQACIGGFQFRFGSKIIPFDFYVWETSILLREDIIHILLSSGTGYFANSGIYEEYEDDILRVGIDPNIIDARFMSSVDEIVDFGSSIVAKKLESSDNNYKLIDDIPYIISMYFVDEYDHRYMVDAAVLGEYNKKVEEIYAERINIMKGDN